MSKQSAVPHTFKSPVLVLLSFWRLFYFERIKKNKTPEHQRDKAGALSDVIGALKSLGDGRVVIYPCYRAVMVKVIAQLISAVKIYIIVHLSAGGSIKTVVL